MIDGRAPAACDAWRSPPARARRVGVQRVGLGVRRSLRPSRLDASATTDAARRARPRRARAATPPCSSPAANAFATADRHARPRGAPRVRRRQQLLQRQLGDGAGVDRRPRRARSVVQRPVVLVVPLRRTRRARRRRRRRSRARSAPPPVGRRAGRHGWCPTPPTAASCRTARSTASPPEGRIVIDADRGPGHVRATARRTRCSRPPTRSRTSAYGPLADGVMVSPRIAPAVFGVGLLEAVPDDASLALADPDDADGDGISGRAEPRARPGRRASVLGRFGWKANVADRRAAERRRVPRRHRDHELAASRAGLHRRRARRAWRRPTAATPSSTTPSSSA